MQPPDGFIWVNHGWAPGGVSVSTGGVAATWWTAGEVYQQRVAFVGSDGALWQRVIEDTLHARHYVVGADDYQSDRSALISSWLSGGYYHYAGAGP